MSKNMFIALIPKMQTTTATNKHNEHAQHIRYCAHQGTQQELLARAASRQDPQNRLAEPTCEEKLPPPSLCIASSHLPKHQIGMMMIVRISSAGTKVNPLIDRSQSRCPSAWSIGEILTKSQKPSVPSTLVIKAISTRCV